MVVWCGVREGMREGLVVAAAAVVRSGLVVAVENELVGCGAEEGAVRLTGRRGLRWGVCMRVGLKESRHGGGQCRMRAAGFVDQEQPRSSQERKSVRVSVADRWAPS